jgi:hypothetical protein
MVKACRPLIGLSCAAIASGGCSLTVDADRPQCSTNQDCEQIGEAFAGSVCVTSFCQLRPDPNWSCLDEDPTSVSPPSGQVRLIIPMVDIVSAQPKPGVEVQLCERLDSECTMPLVTAVSNPRGEVDVLLRSGFNGYVRWQAPDVYPTLYFFGTPLVRDSILPVDLISPQVFAGVNSMFAADNVEGRVPVVVFVRNCAGAPASGIVVSVLEGDQATRAFYLADGLFPASQTETTEAGVSRVINVPLGAVTIRGELADGREIGSASVLTRAGFATLANLGPAR